MFDKGLFQSRPSLTSLLPPAAAVKPGICRREGDFYDKNIIPVLISISESVTDFESAGRAMTRPFLGGYGFTQFTCS